MLAATAVPVELRRFDLATFYSHWGAFDLTVNILGYAPLGIVLVNLGFWRTTMVAALLSLFAELCQFFMMHRFPSSFDLVANVAGAGIGFVLARQGRIEAPAIHANGRTAWLSVLAALVIVGFEAVIHWDELFLQHEELLVNCHGVTSPGSLEAIWTFEESANGAVLDSSGNRLDGTLVDGSTLSNGIHGKAVKLDGRSSYVDFGRPVNLRFMGSLTIMAWINSASFPTDDAAIVSSHSPGYQLDTTVDKGPRTIGFKLVDPCGNLMARYGATELVRDTWYHVAGVYDADARTLDVYLNGRLDNGYLLGPVISTQQASGEHVYVGRRADPSGYHFAGLIDDLRIDSKPLTQLEVQKAMNGIEPDRLVVSKPKEASASEVLTARLSSHPDRCHEPTSPKNSFVPLFAVALGMLSSFSCAGFWSRQMLSLLAVSLVVGLLLALAASTALPSYVVWMLPLFSLTGGASIAASLIEPDNNAKTLAHGAPS